MTLLDYGVLTVTVLALGVAVWMVCDTQDFF